MNPLFVWRCGERGSPFGSQLSMELSEATVVVAHPDDEILWFASIFAKVTKIILCYGSVDAKPKRAEQRRHVVGEYPLPTVEFLDLPEPGKLSPELEDKAVVALIGHLAPALRGATTVFTHNAWGEYGHDDHRRVHAAVLALRSQAGFAAYVSSYIGRQALAAFDGDFNHGIDEVVSFPVDQAEIEPIFALYKSHSCWTWAPDWRWPKQETFFRLGEDVTRRPTAIPVQLIC